MRVPALSLALLAGALPAFSQALPAWWKAFTAAPRLETAFRQESESAVFGKLEKRGKLRLAKGGRIRVEYQKGLLLVCDGKAFVQYDAQARTASKVDLQSAAKEAPLLQVLLDPGSLEQVFTVKPGQGPDALVLEPRRKGLPRVDLQGRGGLPRSLAWTDPTGARQVLEFLDPKVPAAAFDASTFAFKAPQGTRWIDAP